MEKRIDWIDIAKGIGIICIVLGHLGNGKINSIVYTFHVPLFFFLSGFLLNIEGKTKDFIKKKSKALLLPYAVTCVLICVFSIPINILRHKNWKRALSKWIFASFYGSGNKFEEPFFIPAIGAIWFLLALFWGLLFMKVLSCIKKEVRVCAVFLICGLSVWSVKYLWLPFSIQAGGCALPFLYLGYMCRQIQPQIEQIIHTSSEVKITASVFFIANWIYAIRNYRGFYLVRAFWGNGILDFWGSICGTAVVLIVAKLLSKKRGFLFSMLSGAGKYSLLVMCVHVIEFYFVPWKKIYAYVQQFVAIPDSNYIIFSISAKAVFIPVVVLIMLKIPLLRFLYGYKVNKKKKM
nr:acyltransferase family protein [Lachnospiraceae bacterium]